MKITYEMLKAGWKKASKGKHLIYNQAKYEYHLETNLFNLQERLATYMFWPSPLREKEIWIPKHRIAQVPSLEDKIVQHVICDNYVYDALSKSMIKETAACLKDRGDQYATDILKEQLRHYYRHNGKHFYVLKCDIHSYCASIDHGRLKELIERYISDKDIKHIMLLFVDMTDVGLPLGLQQSQLLANVYLSELDHKLKERFRAKYYGRYMDDFYIISDDLKYLKHLLSWIDYYVLSIGLTLNPKTAILKDRFDFLGFTFFLRDGGKAIMRLRKDKLKTERNRLKLQVRYLSEGKITPQQLADSYSGWRAHALRGDCRNVILATDERLNHMLKETGYELKVYKRNGVMICQEQSQPVQQEKLYI